MKKIFEWFKAKLNIRFVVRRAVERYYSELLDIEYEINNDLCVFGKKYTETYRYQKLRLGAEFLKFKIEFLNNFI